MNFDFSILKKLQNLSLTHEKQVNIPGGHEVGINIPGCQATLEMT